MKIATAEAMMEAGATIGRALRPGDVVTLEGPLAAGKTTLVRGLLAAIGHRGEVPSPTFAIVQPYDDTSPPIWHADLYRLEEPSDLLELGLDDVLVDGALLVEWPDRAGPGAWPEALALSLALRKDGSRALTAKVPPSWEGRWPLP